MKRTHLILLFLLLTIASTGQTGVLAIPESYISRNSIKSICYLNSDSVQVSRILFTKSGFLKEHSRFLKYRTDRDSLLQVDAYEYDSTNLILAHSYFQYTLGSGEFPLVTNALHNSYSQNDSIKISRYASAFGHFYNYSKFKDRVEYIVSLNDSIKEVFSFYGERLNQEVFNSDSIVFNDDLAIWSFKYNETSLNGYWCIYIREEKHQLICRIWFNESGLPEKEIVFKNGKSIVFNIVVEKWK
jgi:hypothetical protein